MSVAAQQAGSNIQNKMCGSMVYIIRRGQPLFDSPNSATGDPQGREFNPIINQIKLKLSFSLMGERHGLDILLFDFNDFFTN